MKIVFSALLLLSVTIIAAGQTKHSYTFFPSGKKPSGLYHPNVSIVKPGDTIFLKGDFDNVNIINLHGAPSKPVVITNKGAVTIGGYKAYSFHIDHSSYFKIVGQDVKGSPGLIVDGGINGPISIAMNFCNNLEIAHLKIQHGAVGIVIKNNPVCKFPESHDNGFSYDNIKIHDIQINNCGAEGIYFGYSGGYSLKCPDGTKMVPNSGKNLKIYNVTVDHCGWDGIQAGRIKDLEISNCRVTNYGTKNRSSQQTGIQVGEASTGSVNNCYVSTGTGSGYSGGYSLKCPDGTKMVPNSGKNLKIYNVTVDHCGWDGIQAGRIKGLEISNCRVTNYGTKNRSSQQTGIQVGEASTGSVNNCYVSTGTGDGYLCQGMGDFKFYKDTTINSGITDSTNCIRCDGMYLSTNPVNKQQTRYWIYNNVIKNAGRNGIFLTDYHNKAGYPNYIYKNNISGSFRGRKISTTPHFKFLTKALPSSSQ